MNLNKYTTVKYVDRGRTIARGCDCWVLARIILMVEFGWPELPEFGWVSPSVQQDMNLAEVKSASLFQVVDRPTAGVMVCVFDSAGNFRHVGVTVIADGILSVIHIASRRGVQVPSVRDFENDYGLTNSRIEYRQLRGNPGL